MVQNFQMLAGTELSIINSLMVTLIGVGVVFAMLALLVVIVELLHFVLKENKEAKPADAPVAEQKPEQRISAGVMADVPEAENAKDDGEFLAALSTAISVATGKPNGSFKIKSIKKG